jgi:hypothetical protein
MKQGTSGMVSGLVQDFIAQLRAVTEGLEDLGGFRARRPLAPGTFPLPGALSAAQLTAISGSVAAQRRSIEALQAQLSSFDEQLAVLEQILSPLHRGPRPVEGPRDFHERQPQRSGSTVGGHDHG